MSTGTSHERLAVFGGAPAFDEPLHVGRPNLGARGSLERRLGELLDRNWLTNDGPFVREFETQIAEYVGIRYCVAMCNGTVALEIAARALGLAGEVIVPAFTFVATAHALQWQEITPVFCDVDPETHTLDPDRVEEMITPRTSAILGVHLWGSPCATDRLATIAGANGLKLLFDAAHGFGCSIGHRMLGQFGDCEILSFHATKFLNSFEGGAVVTDDADLADRVRLMRNFGFAGYDKVVYVGTNGKMIEVAAAMGLTSLESVSDFLRANEANYRRYACGLAGLPGVRLLPLDGRGRSNYQYIVVEIDRATAGISRDGLVHALWEENILARRYFHPGVHRMEPYRSYFPHAGLLLPQTERLCDEVIALPTGTSVSVEDVDKITGIVALALKAGAEIDTQLPSLPPDYFNRAWPKPTPVLA